MTDLIQIGPRISQPILPATSTRRATAVIWLQAVTLTWMLVECGVSLYAAAQAHSSALLAFGSDSFVELLSAIVVLLQFIPGIALSERRAARFAGTLLFILAFVVATTAGGSLAFRIKPDTSYTGMAITIAALIIMPILAALKRRQARQLQNAALAADAVQSATCAFLAATTLAGLAINAAFHIAWIDPVAAFIAVPVLIKEGRSAWRGHVCGCC